LWLIEFHHIVPSALEFNTFFLFIEKSANTKNQYNNRNCISNLPVFDEPVVRVLEDAAGKLCKIFEVTILICVEVGNQPGYKDTAEQRQ